MNDQERSIGSSSQSLNRGVGKPNPVMFRSANDAAAYAIRQFNPQSINRNLEFGGTIYQLRVACKFSYVTPPNIQSPGFSGGHVSTAQTIPPDAIEVGRWHTHGKTENVTDEDFSPEDIRLVWNRQLPSWLGTPKGAIKKAIPSRGGVVILDIQPSESTRPNIRFVPFPSGRR